MLLMELKTTIGDYKGIPIIPIKQDPNLDIEPQHPKLIGAGTEATAFKSSTKPNTIHRISKLKNKANSPTLNYTVAVLQNQDNPYFPKIYNAKILRSRWYDYLVVEMEKLIPIQHSKLKDNMSEFFRMAGIPHDPVHLTDKKAFDFDLYSAFNSDDGRKDIMNKTQDPQLKQALKIISPLIAHYGGDVHQDNIMIRLTSVGPQLVLTDPIHPDMYGNEEFEDY